MNFQLIRLTKGGGEPLWVNPLQIRAVHNARTGSRIEFDGEHALIVQDAPEQIAALVQRD